MIGRIPLGLNIETTDRREGYSSFTFISVKLLTRVWFSVFSIDNVAEDVKITYSEIVVHLVTRDVSSPKRTFLQQVARKGSQDFMHLS